MRDQQCLWHSVKRVDPAAAATQSQWLSHTMTGKLHCWGRNSRWSCRETQPFLIRLKSHAQSQEAPRAVCGSQQKVLGLSIYQMCLSVFLNQLPHHRHFQQSPSLIYPGCALTDNASLVVSIAWKKNDCLGQTEHSGLLQWQSHSH